MKKLESPVNLDDIAPIPDPIPQVTKNVFFKEGIWKQLKAAVKSNGHTLKQAVEWGANAYMIKHGNKKNDMKNK